MFIIKKKKKILQPRRPLKCFISKQIQEKEAKGEDFHRTFSGEEPPPKGTRKGSAPISCIPIPGLVPSEQGGKARTPRHKKHARFSQSQVPVERSLGDSGSGSVWWRDLGAGGDAQFSQSWLRNLTVIRQSPHRT